MNISISSDAEGDLSDGYWFYEQQEPGLGSYFRSSILADIESLIVHGGVQQIIDGYHRMLCKTFPYSIYYRMDTAKSLTIVAVLGQRQNPDRLRDRITPNGE